MVLIDGNVDGVDGVKGRMNWKGRNMMEGPGMMSECQRWT